MSTDKKPRQSRESDKIKILRLERENRELLSSLEKLIESAKEYRKYVNENLI